MKPAMSLSGKSVALQAGARVGPYRLLEQIGWGGMGQVFLAERVDGGYEQRVAIKFVNKSEDEEELLPRFQQEQQALAMLAHSNIARLLDGGVTEGAQPYLVMEYIVGHPLDVYCDQHQCDTQKRVQLFREVLAGVQHAHQHFLVHRDLKPSNILVTAEGVPKLLDFGIAKWLQAPTHKPKLTIKQPMTLQYASPEQVKNEAITTGSDVYALGVLLYEVLTGHLPYRQTATQAYDLQKAICEQEPEKPSAAINRVESVTSWDQQTTKMLTPETVSATREGSHQKLRRRLVGDLDSIVLKALRKAPQDRYGSVEQLSEDLRRYLEGQPVSAREGKFSYRAWKFMQRNAAQLAVAAAFVILVISFAINAAVQAERVAKERDKAIATTNFLTRTLEPLDPVYVPIDSVTMRTQLDSGLARIKTDLVSQPELQATLLGRFGDINRKYGRFDLADSLLRASLTLRRQLSGDRHIEVAKTLSGLGRLSANKGNFPQAESLLVEALAIYQDQLGDKSTEFVTASNILVQVYTESGQLGKAAATLTKTRDLMQQLQPEGSYELGELLLNLSQLNTAQGDVTSAQKNAQHAYEMLLKYSNERNPELAGALNNWAAALIDQGRPAEAEPLLRKAYRISVVSVTDNHPLTAYVKSTLGVCLARLQHFEEAESLLVEANQFFNANLGVQHPYSQQTIKNCVMLYEAWGKPQKAEEHRQLLTK